MKIIIPVEEKSLNSLVCQSFGRTLYFAVYDTENGDCRFLDNGAAASQGGAGIKAAQSILDNKAEIVITFRCGENAAAVLSAGGVKLYKAVQGTVSENIKLFLENKLEVLSEIHPGFHNHGAL